MKARAALCVLMLVLCGASSSAQRAPPSQPPERPYPYDVVPVDAIRGHLLEGPFKEPMGVSYDTVADELYVADSKSGLIGIFDPRGAPVFSFGGPAMLVDPQRVEALADGTIVVLDNGDRALKRFNYRGQVLPDLSCDYPAVGGWPAGTARIGAFTFDRAGRLYVADLERPQVLVYDARHEFVRALRSSPKGAQFRRITALAVSSDGLLAVTDFEATPVQVIDTQGGLVSAFGRRDIGRDSFTAPFDVDFDEDGFLYVVDMLRHEVKVFDVKGQFLAQFGGWFSANSGGRAPGEMLYPTSLAIAPGGLLYVSERFGMRVQLFKRLPRGESGRARVRLPVVGDDPAG